MREIGRRGVRLWTAFSGKGTAETIFHQIGILMQDKGCDGLWTTKFSVDKKASALDVLKAMPGESCIFDDLLKLLTPEDWQNIEDMKPPQKATAHERQQAYTRIGAYLMQYSYKCFSEKCSCRRHGKDCPLWDSSDIAEALTVSMVGSICKAFSSRGKHERESSENTMPYHVWVALMRFLQPAVAFHEITPTAPADRMLERDLGDIYRINSTKVCPTRIGHPHTRERIVSALHHKRKASYTGSWEEMWQILGASVDLSGVSYES